MRTRVGSAAVLLAVLLASGGAFGDESRPTLLLQTGHSAMPLDAVLGPDGRLALSFCDGGGSDDALLWNVASGRVLAQLPRKGLLRTAAWTPDGKHFVLGCGVQMELWDAGARREVVRYPIRGVFGTSEELEQGILDPTGRVLAVPGGAGRRDAVSLFDVRTGRLRAVVRDAPRTLARVALSPGGARAATLTWSEETEGETTRYRLLVSLWDTATGGPTGGFDLGSHEHLSAFALAWHPGGSRLLVAHHRRAEVRGVEDGAVEALYEAPGEVDAAVFSPDGERFVLSTIHGFSEGLATLHETATGALVAELGPAGTTRSPSFRRPHFTPDGSLLALPDMQLREGVLRVLAWPSLRVVAALALRPWRVAHVESIRFLEGDRIAVGARMLGREHGEDAFQEITFATAPRFRPEARRALEPPGEEADLKALREQGYPSNMVEPVARSADGTRLVTVADDEDWRYRRLVFFDVPGRRVVHVARLRETGVASITFSPDGAWVLTALGRGRGSATVIWDAATGKERRRVVDELDAAEDAPWVEPLGAWSADGSEIYANERGLDRNPRTAVFDAATGRRKRVLASYVTPGMDRPLLLSPGGRVMAQEHHLYDARTGALLRDLDDDYWAAAFSPDGRRLAAFVLSGWKLAAAVVDVETGATLTTITLLNEADWVAVTPDGFFEGTPDAQRAVSWRMAGEVFPLELYGDAYHRADVVGESLRGAVRSEAPPSGSPPSLGAQGTAIDAASMTVVFTAKPGSAGGRIRDLRVYVDGRDLAVVQGAPIAREDLPEGGARFTARVAFPAGKPTTVVAAVATDESGLRSQPAVVPLVRPGAAAPADRRLFLLAVGVSDYGDPESNLRYGRADAEALAAHFQTQQGRAFAAVESTLLTDREATAPAIRRALASLRARCGPADLAVVHLSGHGVRDPEGALYYVPFGADPADVAATFLRWHELVVGLQGVRAASVLLFADACHAGAFGHGPALASELASPLAREAGVMVFSSSSDLELSEESTAWGHGAFTAALLEGLGGAADLIPDKRITVGELQTYVASRVKVLTMDRQHPHIPFMQDFDPDLVVTHLPW